MSDTMGIGILKHWYYRVKHREGRLPFPIYVWNKYENYIIKVHI